MHSVDTIAQRIARLSPEKLALFESQLALQNKTQEAIAIVGMGCRFPQANDPESFWQLLRNGTDAITEVPPERWNGDAFYDSALAGAGKLNTRWGGFLKQVDQFDPYFFGISPREAERIDPQHRLLLEVAWESLEYAGQAPDQLAGSKTGVFVGISTSDYSQMFLNHYKLLDAYTATGSAHSIAANRLSYLLDLRGPSLSIDTACSSSLVAVHLACQSLRNHECNLALAGGVNLILSPKLTIAFSQAQMMAPDGRCKTFDARADGYVRGEGCGVVALKRLSDALKDGNRVLAVIRGSAVSQDGRSNGLTAPNGLAQQSVIHEALRNAKVNPEQVSYIEVHGTGTALGDPIEVESLKAVFRSEPHDNYACRLGSVKTNIGHLEAAAGIASLIKVVLSLQKGEIPPHLHLKQLNPHIVLDGTPFSIPTTCQPWAAEAGQRLAGVSSFGFGGTIAHLVLAEAPPSPSVSSMERPMHLFTLSAKSEEALRSLAQQYQATLATQPTLSLADVCFTTNVGRSHFTHRLALITDSMDELRAQLDAFTNGQQPSTLLTGQASTSKRTKIGFLFTGQGSQYPNMGRVLYETEPIFRQALDRCSEILQPYLEHPLLSVLYPETEEDPRLTTTAYAQPALFALEYALTELWRSWGIEPDIVIGHSVGEYVAACVAGAMSLADGLKLIAERGRLMQALPPDGMMAAVFTNAEQVTQVLKAFQPVAIAALNSPQNTVISGPRELVQVVLEQLERQGIRSCPLNVSHAFHSPLMEPMLPAFKQVAQTIEFQPLRLPLVANLTGNLMPPGEVLDANYWCQHILAPVQFATGISTLSTVNPDLLLEVGSHPTLVQIGKSVLPDWKGFWLSSLNRRERAGHSLLDSIQHLYLAGVPINWLQFHQHHKQQRLPLPTYPFQRERYWLNVPAEIETNKSNLNLRNGIHSHTVAEKMQTLLDKIDDTLASIRANWVLPAFNGTGANRKSNDENGASTDCVTTDTHESQTNGNGSHNGAIASNAVAEKVQCLLSDIGKIPRNKLSLKSRIHDELGFDSLMLVESRSKLMAAFPHLRDLPLSFLFSGVTVAELIEFVSKAETAPIARTVQITSPNLDIALPHLQAWAREFEPDRPMRIEKHLVHKDVEHNVLIARLKQLQDDVILGEITQDIQHPFFYEHAKDHVTGLYIIEAARQFGTALAHLCYASPLGMSFILDEMQSQFYKFAETNQPLFVIANIDDKFYADGQLARMQVRASIVQGEDVVALVSGLFRIFSSSKYNHLREDRLPATTAL
jgi:acyl transferase domain-containing protein